jgi:Uma2 family endonuclease
MATNPRRLRAADVPYIPVTDPSISGYELVDGQLVPVMPSTRTPSRVTRDLCMILHAHVTSAGTGEIYPDVWCRLGLARDPERLRAPDIAYFTNEKLEAAGSDEIFQVPPDLAAEVFSPTNERKPGNFQQRIRDLLDAGVRLLWVIYPEAGYVIVLRPDGSARMLRETDTLDGEDVLPGFRVALHDLLRDRS